MDGCLPEGFDIIFISRESREEVYNSYKNRVRNYFGSLKDVSMDFCEIGKRALAGAIAQNLYLGGAVEDVVSAALDYSEDDLDMMDERDLARDIYALGESAIPYYYINYNEKETGGRIIDFPIASQTDSDKAGNRSLCHSSDSYDCLVQ